MAFPAFPASSSCLLQRCLTKELFETLIAARSLKGCDFKGVIRSAVALPGAGIGAFAGDADCFSVAAFGALLRPLLGEVHAGAFVPGTKQNRCMDADKVQVPLRTALDPAMVSRVSLVATRSVEGYAFAPTIATAERSEIEARLQSAVASFGDDLAGSYCPADALLKIDPEAAARLKGDEYWAAAGCDREWPAGRGLFTSADQQLTIEVNTTEHLVIRVEQDGSDVKGAFHRLCSAVRARSCLLRRYGPSV